MRRAALLATLAGLTLLCAGLTFAPAVLAGGGCHAASTESTDRTTTNVSLDQCAFGPTIARVSEGQLVTFVNNDHVPHNVTGTGWASPMLETGGRYTHSFAAPGIYPYSCALHPGMNGVLIVGAAVAGPVASAQAQVPVQVTRPEPATSDPEPPVLALGALVVGLVAGATGWAIARSRAAYGSAVS